MKPARGAITSADPARPPLTRALPADLRQQSRGGDAEFQRPAVAAIGRHDAVALLQRRGGADRHGFLAGAQTRSERATSGGFSPLRSTTSVQRPDEMDAP